MFAQRLLTLSGITALTTYDAPFRQLVRFWPVLLLGAAAMPRLSAAPSVTVVANAASNIGFNSPLAQGSIFVLKGTGLGPAQISIAPSPFQSTSLSETSVAVTVGTTTVNALMYYTSDTQVAALLPSNTPTGAGSFTVTYNGQTSNAIGHGIVASNVGLFTVDSSGMGPAIVTYPDGSLVSPAKAVSCGGPYTICGAANPGDTLILWGTGIGPVSGDDQSGAGLGQNMPDIPLAVWLGGVQAPVSYQGRSGCCIGEDEIFITVPNNAPTGCAVPLVVQIGTTSNTISNSTVIPVANGSRECAPLAAPFTAIGAASMVQLASTSIIGFAEIDLEKDGSPSGTGYQDNAQFTFAKILSVAPGTASFFPSYIDNQPLNTCMVYPNLNGNGPSPIASWTLLDAGTNFALKGPSGTVTLPANNTNFSTISTAGNFLIPGSFTFTATGGADIGPFTDTFTIPTMPTLTSPTSPSPITRSNGMTVSWTGGGGSVQLFVSSATDSSNTTGSTAVCTAPASAGSFTISPYVLLALPVGNFAFFGFESAEAYYPFTATGIDAGWVQTQMEGPGFGVSLK
jgi:uncharacterized protein (TIGR03437 family)